MTAVGDLLRLPHCPNPQFHSARGGFEVCGCPRDPADFWAPVHWMGMVHWDDQFATPMYCQCGPQLKSSGILIWDGNHYGYYCRDCLHWDGRSGRLLAADCVCCSCGGPALRDHGYRLFRHIAPTRTG